MNRNLDIDKLRSLLQKYYDGETSPEEEMLIITFFSKTEAEYIPQDLTDDRQLFLSMKELLSSRIDMEIPDDLLGKINRGIMDNAIIASRDKKKNRKKPFVYSAVAAVACLMLVLGLRYNASTSGLMHKAPDNMAKTPSVTIKDTISIIAEPFVAKLHSEPSERKPSTDAPVHQTKHAVAGIDVSPEVDDGYIEITDPEQAREIILEIGRLLANNSIKTNEAIHMVENTVEDYKEITKSILQ